MGVMTLEEFQNETSQAMGDNRPTSSGRLTSWINRAYREVCSNVAFERLQQLFSFNTAAGVREYGFPTGVISVISLADLTNKRLLRRGGLRNYHRLDRDNRGIPKLWFRHNDFFLLWPTPDSISSMEGFGHVQPTALSAFGDLTVIPASWDIVILNLAIRNGLTGIGRMQEATGYYQTAVNLSRQILLEGDLDQGQAALGLNLHDEGNFDDMTEMQSDWTGV